MTMPPRHAGCEPPGYRSAEPMTGTRLELRDFRQA